MEPTSSLSQFYDDLKAQQDRIHSDIHPMGMPHHGMMLNPMQRTLMWRQKAMHNCEQLKDDCCKKILVDVYFKILPLDHPYKCQNMHQCHNDIGNMLQMKGMTPTQYLTSCYEKTKAPLLNMILQSVNDIGKRYLEEADEQLQDATENDLPVDEPPEADADDPKIDSQLLDITNDTEYETFVDQLKKKTIDKIVSDISKLLTDGKEEKDMEFNKPVASNDDETAGEVDQTSSGDEPPIPDEGGDTPEESSTEPTEQAAPAEEEAQPVELPEVKPEQESTISIGRDFITRHLWRNKAALTPSQNDMVMGMVIREATLNQLDVVFRQPGQFLEEFRVKINNNKGAVINESSIEIFQEKKAVKKQPDEKPAKVEKQRTQIINLNDKNYTVTIKLIPYNGKSPTKGQLKMMHELSKIRKLGNGAVTALKKYIESDPNNKSEKKKVEDVTEYVTPKTLEIGPSESKPYTVIRCSYKLNSEGLLLVLTNCKFDRVCSPNEFN